MRYIGPRERKSFEDNLVEGDSVAEVGSILPTTFLCLIRADRSMSGFGWVVPAVTLLELVAGVGRQTRLEDEGISTCIYHSARDIHKCLGGLLQPRHQTPSQCSHDLLSDFIWTHSAALPSDF